jgi:hypothetical protein
MTTIPAGGKCTTSFKGFQCDALDTAELYTIGVPGFDTFTAAGLLNIDRGNYGAAILDSGAHSGDLAVFGGFCCGVLVGVGTNRRGGRAKYLLAPPIKTTTTNCSIQRRACGRENRSNTSEAGCRSTVGGV